MIEDQKSTPKVQDRVRVEYEGTVELLCTMEYPAEFVYVRDDEGTTIKVKSKHCTVIKPPLRVGQEVTGENIDRLPVLTRVSEGPHVYRLHIDGHWYGPGSSTWVSKQAILGMKIEWLPEGVWA